MEEGEEEVGMCFPMHRVLSWRIRDIELHTLNHQGKEYEILSIIFEIINGKSCSESSSYIAFALSYDQA